MSTVAKRSKKTSRTAEPRGKSSPEFQLPAGVVAGKESILASDPQQIPIALIDVVAKTDRQNASDEELKIPELAQSIAAVGLQQPILLAKQDTGRYALIFGERRLRAAKLLKHERISAIVRDATAIDPVLDQQLVEARAVENVQRLDPSPIGEALAIADIFEIKLKERIAQWADGLPKDQREAGPPVSQMAFMRASAIERTANRVGKPVAWVRDRMFLAGFSGKARDLVASGRLPLTHAREIAKVADPKRRDELAEDFAIGNGMSSEGQPGDIEDLRRQVASSLYSLAQVPWQLSVAFGGKSACSECPHNSLNNPGLFEGKQLFGDDPKQADKYAKGYHGLPSERPEPKSGVCTKPACYQDKTADANRAVSSTATRLINRYEPAKAAKKKDADGLIGLSAIKEAAPAFVSPFVVKERIAARLEARSAPAKKATTKERPSYNDWDSPQAKARRAGEAAYRVASHAWHDKVANPAMAKYLAEVPGRWAIYTVAKNLKAWQKAASYNAKTKDFESPEILRGLRLIVTPTLEGLIELEGMCGTKLGLFGDLDSGNYEPLFIAKILNTLGVQAAPPPIEKDFIDRELAKLKKEPAKPAAAKKPASKKGKSDDEDQEDDE